MTPDLIAAAAKLCGWHLSPNSMCAYSTELKEQALEGELTDAGLLALIKRLAECGWRYQMVGDEGGSLSLYGWSQRYFDSEGHTLSRYKVDNDFATATCMAAKVEVGDES